MTKINICICTYQRPKLLTDCLQSLETIIVPSGTEVTVTVIDNDQTGSAEVIVNDLIGIFPFNIYYHCESKRGIPCARNRAVEETHRLGSDYLVFIDDDEWVEPIWLDRLYTYCQNQGGDIVVSGNVISDFPDKTPDQIRHFLSRKQRATGTLLASCATNNVLIPIHVTKTLGLRFDESNPLEGGTDMKFFYEATKVGVVIVRCAEALVHETVPETRISLWWLSKRHFRKGITVAWRKKQESHLSTIIFSTSKRGSKNLLTAGTMLLRGKKRERNKHWLKVCRSLGILFGILGLKIDSYKNVDGE